jgi:AraC-like DNA-binding protein
MNTVVFDSLDLEHTEEFLRTHYVPLRIGSTSRRSPTHITSAASSAISVDHLDLGFEMSYDVDPLGKLCLCDVLTGGIEDHAISGWTTPENFGPGESFVLAPHDRPYTGRINRAHYRVTLLSTDLLDQVATPARGADSIRLLDHRPVDATAVKRLRHAVDHVEQHVLGDPAVMDSPLIVATASRYLAACVLATFPNTGLSEVTAADRNGAGSIVVRRAVEYIETYAGMNISPADVAAAAHITVRGLQYAFRKHLDTTPMAYVRRVRLDRAHRELLAGDPAKGDTVTAIATRWGFLHQGRFVATYRRVYGRTPGQTLRG